MQFANRVSYGKCGATRCKPAQSARELGSAVFTLWLKSSHDPLAITTDSPGAVSCSSAMYGTMEALVAMLTSTGTTVRVELKAASSD